MSQESTALERINQIIDNCDIPNHLNGLVDISDYCVDATSVSKCLNKYLVNYGINTSVLEGTNKVVIDTNSMSKVIDFALSDTSKPYITPQFVSDIENILKAAEQSKVSIMWSQEGMKRFYYLAKQTSFTLLNSYNLASIAGATTTAARISPTGAAQLTFGTSLAISFSLGYGLQIIENLVPNSWNNTKVAVKTAKYVVSIPYRGFEWGLNSITDVIETKVFKWRIPLPINLTKEYTFDDGPNITEISSLKQKVIERTIKILERWKGE